jgi:hypothetical protein
VANLGFDGRVRMITDGRLGEMGMGVEKEKRYYEGD